MRILWCTWKDLAHPSAGGAERYTHAVASRLAARGHEVQLCTAGTGPVTVEVVDGVEIRRRGGPLVGAYRQARLHYERTHAERPWDLIVDEINTRPFNAPLWSMSTPVLALCYQLAAEVWHHEAPLPLAAVGRWVLEPWWWTRYRRTTVATISASSAESLAAHGVRDVRVLPVGGDFPARPDVARASVPTVAFVGRMSAMKRPLDALAAHELLLERRPGARLWFLGGGPDLDAVRRAAAGVAGVEVLGHVDEATKAARVAEAWALVATSVREGWGLVVSEAAAMGTYSVAYRVPGLVDSVGAAGGVLCDPDPASLATALDDHLDRFAASAGPATTGTTSWDRVADHFEELAAEVAATSARRVPA